MEPYAKEIDMWYLTGKHKESNQDPELFFPA